MSASLLNRFNGVRLCGNKLHVDTLSPFMISSFTSSLLSELFKKLLSSTSIKLYVWVCAILGDLYFVYICDGIETTYGHAHWSTGFVGQIRMKRNGVMAIFLFLSHFWSNKLHRKKNDFFSLLSS